MPVSVPDIVTVVGSTAVVERGRVRFADMPTFHQEAALKTATIPTEGELSSGVAKVQRMASELASRVRYAQIVGHPIPAEHVTALVAAARLLQDYGEPWPHVVAEALQEFAKGLERDKATPENKRAQAAGDDVVYGLTRFLEVFRREKDLTMEAGA